MAFVIGLLILLSFLSHGSAENKVLTEGVDYKLISGNLLVKIPSGIDLKTFKNFENNKLDKQTKKYVYQALTTVANTVTEQKDIQADDLIVSYADDNFKMIEAPPLESATAVGPDTSNRLTFEIAQEGNETCAITTGCVPWTQEEAEYLEQAIAEGEPIMQEIFGPPFTNAVIPVLHLPGQPFAGKYNTTTHTISLRDPSLTGPYPEQTLPEKPTFWHEWTHVNHWSTAYLLSLNWTEPIAQFMMQEIVHRTGYNGFFHLPYDSSEYELFNKPYLSSEAMSPYENYTGYANPPRYTASPTIFMKLYREYPDLLKSFNAELFDRGKFRVEREGLTVIQDIIDSQGNGTIEGEKFQDWYAEQYSVMKTNGSKFGGIIFQKTDGSSNPKVLLRLSYVKTRYPDPISSSVDDPASDSPLTGTFKYELLNSQGQQIAVTDPISVTRTAQIDITEQIKSAYGGSLPKEKICAVITLKDINKSLPSCYFVYGNLEPEELGINGVVGGSEEIVGGDMVRIIPTGGQSKEIPVAQVPVINGRFFSAGQNNDYFNEGGQYRVEYRLADTVVTSKYITKEKNSSYFTAFSNNDVPKTPTSLSSSPITNNRTTFELTLQDAAVSYFIYQEGKSPFLYNKTWEQSGAHLFQTSTIVINLQNGNRFSLYIGDASGVGSAGATYLIGSGTIKAYISKWLNHRLQYSNQPLTFKIQVSNTSTENLPINLTDPLEQPPAYDISDNGIEDNGIITWPEIILSSGSSKVYSFKQQLHPPAL